MLLDIDNLRKELCLPVLPSPCGSGCIRDPPKEAEIAAVVLSLSGLSSESEESVLSHIRSICLERIDGAAAELLLRPFCCSSKDRRTAELIIYLSCLCCAMVASA